MGYNQVNISSGHSINCQGAADIINEVTEAKKVVDRVYEIIKASGKQCYKYHDTSSSSTQNLVNIVNWHNGFKDGVDVSIHFNAYTHVDKPMGTEVCYYSNSSLAATVSKEVATAGGFINRGAKQRTGLYFLKHTNKPAILIEVCFVDSVADVNLYRANFERICQAIAKSLIGSVVAQAPTTSTPVATAPKPTPTPTPSGDAWVRNLQVELNVQGFRDNNGNKLVVDGIAGSKTLSACPTLRIGARGNITKLMQQKIGVAADGIFGNNTKQAVINYQRSKGLVADGIVGRNTWRKLLGL